MICSVTPPPHPARVMARNSELVRQWEILRDIDAAHHGITAGRLAAAPRRAYANDPARPRRARARGVPDLRRQGERHADVEAAREAVQPARGNPARADGAVRALLQPGAARVARGRSTRPCAGARSPSGTRRHLPRGRRTIQSIPIGSPMPTAGSTWRRSFRNTARCGRSPSSGFTHCPSWTNSSRRARCRLRCSPTRLASARAHRSLRSGGTGPLAQRSRPTCAPPRSGCASATRRSAEWRGWRSARPGSPGAAGCDWVRQGAAGCAGTQHRAAPQIATPWAACPGWPRRRRGARRRRPARAC